MINFKEIYHFSRLERGSNIFQGGGGVQLFPGGGGVQLLIPYRKPYNLWFSRGGGLRIPCPPPLDPHLNNSVHKRFYLMHEIVRTAKLCRLNMPYGCISKYFFHGAALIFVDLAEFFGVKIVNLIFFDNSFGVWIYCGYIFFFGGGGGGGGTTKLDYFGGYLWLFSG